jgi:uncharacterized membrane protein
MEFTNNQTWFTVLLVIHVFFAIAGIGPSFAFAILGPFAGKNPEFALGTVRAMIKIERALVAPTGFVVQWVSGTLLIFNRSAIRDNFFKEEWLVVSVVLYAIILVLSVLNVKASHQMEHMLSSGEAGTPEFGMVAKRTATFGQTMTILTVVIAILMVWKPLSECAGPLLRC